MKRGKVRKSNKNFKISEIKDFFNNKKVLAIIIAAFFVFAIALSFVYIGKSNITGQVSVTGAATGSSGMSLLEGIKSVGGSIIKILELFFKALLGGEVGDAMLFPRVLFLVLIFGIIWLSLNKIDLFSEHPSILIIIAAIVSVLAVRGISSTELIKTMLLPSEALGIALVAGIPFVIYFIVVHLGFKHQSSIVRRVAWIFFAVIFIGLWISRIGELGKLHYIYLFTAVAAIIMALIDGTIKGFFAKIEADKLSNVNKLRLVAELKRQKAEYDDMLTKNVINDSEHKILVRNLQNKARAFTRKKLI